MKINELIDIVDLERKIQYTCPLLSELFKSTDGRLEISEFIDVIFSHIKDEVEEELLDEYEKGREDGLDTGYDRGYESGHDTGYDDGLKDGRGRLAESIRHLLDES